MIKQVIVMRRDLKMRRGKEIAQGAHASMQFLLNFPGPDKLDQKIANESEWFATGYTKICVQAESEEQLTGIYDLAKMAGLTVHMITDSGHTEFNGVPTKTCLAIGPDKAEDIDKLTGHLNLY